MKKAVKVIALFILFLLMVSISAMLVAPFLSRSFVDYGHPLKAEWKQDEKGEKTSTTIIEYPGLGESMKVFYDKVNSPLRPSLLQIIVWFYILGVVYLLCMSALSKLEDQMFRRLGATVIPIQVLLVLLCITSVFVNAHQFNVKGVLTQTITDQELAKSVINDYEVTSFLRCLGLVFALVVADFVVLLTVGGLAEAADRSMKRLKRKAETLSKTDLNLGGVFVVVHGDDMVELSRVHQDFKWHFLIPIHTIRREILNRISLDNLFRYFMDGSKTIAFDELREKLLGSYRERFRPGNDASCNLIRNSLSNLGRGVERAVDGRVKEMSNGSLESAQCILQGVSDRTLARFKQDVVSGIQERIEESLRGFREAVLGRINSDVLGALTHDQAGSHMEVFPEGTKFFFRKGDSTTIVVEEKPQTRTIRFSEGFLAREANSESDSRTRRTNLLLAFPYVVFVIHFRGMGFCCLRVYYSNKPFTSLDDRLFLPNLPNIDNCAGVCLGFPGCQGRTFSERVQEVVSHFWQSEFNNDLRDNYNRMRGNDNHFSDIWHWEANSKIDPTFMLKVEWVPINTSFRELVGSLSQSGAEGEVRNLNEVARRAIEESEEQILGSVRDFCSGIAVDGRFEPTVAKELMGHIKAIAASVFSVVSEKTSELSGETDPEILERFNGAVAEAVGAVLQQEFTRLADEVLIRRQVGSRDLINRIAEGR